MNVYTFTGNLAADAETRHTANGDAVTQFRVAVKYGYGKNEGTNWMNCQYWGKRGESVAQYLKKGQQVAVSGELQLRPYTDKAGAEKTSHDVNVRELTLLGKRQDAESSRDMTPRAAQQQAQDDDFEQDIPF